MKFTELCEDFNLRKPKEAPSGRLPWFIVKHENGSDSINDLLRRFLRKNSYEYLNFNGEVWFLYFGEWRSSEHEVKGEHVHFYLNEYESEHASEEKELQEG